MLAFVLITLMFVAFACAVQSESFQTESPFWQKIGMAVSNNNQYNDYQYILEELPLGDDKYMYRVTYTFGTVPPVWYLKGNQKAADGQIRQGYVQGLKAMLPNSIPGIMRQALPEFKLMIPETGFPRKPSFADYRSDNWKRVGLAAPDYNHYRKDLYVLWEQKLGDSYYKYKVTERYSEMPLSWLLRGINKAKDGEIRMAEFRSRSNNFLKFKLNLDETLVENFEVTKGTGYPGAGVNPWTHLWSSGYKGTSWDGVPPPLGPLASENRKVVDEGKLPASDWETVGRAGMHLSTGRHPYYNYILQERRLRNGSYQYRIYNPDNVDFAGVIDAGPVYIALAGNEKARNLQIRQALPSSLSMELPGYYRLKTRD